jgi:DNA recombination protein RmuC
MRLSRRENSLLRKEDTSVEAISSVVLVLFGLIVGASFAWMLSKGRVRSAEQKVSGDAESARVALAERLASTEQQLQQARSIIKELNELNQTLQAELIAEKERRAAAEEKNARIPELEEAILRNVECIAKSQEEGARLRAEQARLRAELESTTRHAEERFELASKQSEEKLSLLVDARAELTVQFKNLANDILENKTRTFTEQNKTNMDALLKPLGEKIRDFEKRVEETYDKESKQRFSLEGEIRNLRQLNTQMSQDAINLTNALKGQTKTQGIWGEMILERVLESSGLVKGREYEAQVCETDEDGRRMQPDVIVHLPEDRHLIIDSKVNLRAYEQYCTMEDGPGRDEEMKKHLTALRKHVDQLSAKQYQDRFQLNSLDFVLMFVPIEPAYTFAVQIDQMLFTEALEKKIVIVTPSTLHATLRTIEHMWRQEYQSKNAIEIAKRSGALFDKFVGFVEDLEDVGQKLHATQKSYDSAHRKLSSGQGNLINRAELIRQLGAKASKSLPQHVLTAAIEDAYEPPVEQKEEVALLEPALVTE